MPDFTFSGPGGKSITITGPEGATRDQAIGILRQQHPELWTPAAPAKQPSMRSDIGDVAADVAKTIPSAAAEGLIGGVPGVVGDLRNAFQGVNQWIYSKLSPERQAQARKDMEAFHKKYGDDPSLLERAPTSQQVVQGIGIPTHEPTTALGRVVGAGVRGATNPTNWFGPGGVARAMGAGGVGGATGEAVTEVTGSPVAGMIAGGVAAGARGVGRERAAAQAAVTPTVQQIEGAAGGSARVQAMRTGTIQGNDMQVLNARSVNLMERISSTTRPRMNESGEEGLRRGIGSILTDVDNGRVAVVPDEARALREIRSGNINVITREEQSQLETLYRGGVTRRALAAFGELGRGSHLVRHLLNATALPPLARGGASMIAQGSLQQTLDQLARNSQIGLTRQFNAGRLPGRFTLPEIAQAGVRGVESQDDGQGR